MTLVLAILIIAGTDLSWWWLALAVPVWGARQCWTAALINATINQAVKWRFMFRDRPSR